jgi:hypothetical protein
MQNLSERQGKSLEYLRIVGEAARFQQANPGNPWHRAVRDHWIRAAAPHHSVDEIAAAAGLSGDDVATIVRPRGTRASFRTLRIPPRLRFSVRPSGPF